MKKLCGLILIAAFTFSGCSKNDSSKNNNCPSVTVSAPATEVAKLKAYLDSTNTTATADPRGFYYNIITPGASSKPSVCNNIIVGYVGKLTTGKTFDSSTRFSYPLSNLITGWQEGIPLIGSGGSIVLYLPPSLGYGSSATGPIPANSILIFTIDLKSFN